MFNRHIKTSPQTSKHLLAVFDSTQNDTGTFSCSKILYNKMTITVLLKTWMDVDKSDVMSVFIDNFIALCLCFSIIVVYYLKYNSIN